MHWRGDIVNFQGWGNRHIRMDVNVHAGCLSLLKQASATSPMVYACPLGYRRAHFRKYGNVVRLRFDETELLN
jgi:hypothetical protein